MVRQRTIRGDDPSAGSSSVKRCITIAVVIAVFLFMIPSRQNAAEESLRTGQATQKTPNTANRPKTVNPGGKDGALADEEETAEIETEIKAARDDLEELEESELDIQSAKLEGLMDSKKEHFKYSMTKRFGSEMTEAEIGDIAEEMEGRLEGEVLDELKETAEETVETEAETVEGVAWGDHDHAANMMNIREHMHHQEDLGKQKVRFAIDEKANDLKIQMEAKAREIEVELLEKKLSEKLGKSVKIVIENDEIQTKVDDLIKDVLNPAPVDGAGVHWEETGNAVQFDGSVGGEPAESDTDDENFEDDDSAL